MKKVRAHVYVSGLVQGVFFRSNTRKQALKRGVCGWVKNLPDGRVEAIFEGDENMVKEMIEWCKIGPPGAEVSNVEVHWEDYRNEYDTFEILY
ncbi:MAG: acylphosphatase [Nitrososphaerales archaeon]